MLLIHIRKVRGRLPPPDASRECLTIDVYSSVSYPRTLDLLAKLEAANQNYP